MKTECQLSLQHYIFIWHPSLDVVMVNSKYVIVSLQLFMYKWGGVLSLETVNINNKMMIIIWSASSRYKFYIWETLSINIWLSLSTKHQWDKHRVQLFRSRSVEHDPPAKRTSLFQDVVLDTDLCKDVDTTLWFPITWAAWAAFNHLIGLWPDISQEQP